MLAQYPTEVNAWVSAKVESEMTALMTAVEGLRSLAVSVSLHPRERPAAFLRTETLGYLAERSDIIQVLGKVSSVKVIAAAAAQPAGCVAQIVNDQLTAYLQVADLVDLPKEVEKQQKKLDATKKSIASYEQKMAAPNYEERVPEDVRKTNSEKLEALQKERSEMETAITTLQAAIRK